MSEVLTQFREKHPVYKDVDDARLASGIYKKYYSDKLSEGEFYEKIGLSKAPQQIPAEQSPPPATAGADVSITPEQLYKPQTGMESEQKAYEALQSTYKQLQQQPQNEELKRVYEEQSQAYQEAIPKIARAGEPVAEYVTRPLARAAKSVAAGTLGTVGDLGKMIMDAPSNIVGTVAQAGELAGLDMQEVRDISASLKTEGMSPSEYIRDSFDKASAGLTTPRSATERVVDLAGETVAGSGVFASTKKLADATKYEEVARRLGTLVPKTTQGLLASAGAGVGQGVAREASEGSEYQPYIELAGSMLGGLGTDFGIRSTKTIANTLKNTVTKSSAEDVLMRLGFVGDDATYAANQLQNAIDDGRAVGLTELQKRTRGLARTLRKTGGEPQEIIEKGLQRKIDEEISRIVKTSQETMTGKRFFDTLDEIGETYGKVASNAYKEAYKQKIDATPEITKLMERPAIKSALARGREMAENAGEVLPEGQINTKVADYVKRALDEKIEGYVNPLTGRITGGQDLVKAKADWLSQIDAQNPLYVEARRLAGDGIKNRAALDFGKNSRNMTPAAIKRQIKQMSQAEKDAALIGKREDIINEVSKVTDKGSAARRIVKSKYQRDQLRQFFDNESDYKKFMRDMMDEMDISESYTKIMQGSQTDVNLAEGAQLKSGMNFFKKIFSAVSSPREAVGGLSDVIERNYLGIGSANANQLAEAIISPEKAAVLLKRISSRTQKPEQLTAIQNLLRNTMTGATDTAENSQQ